MRHPGVPPPGDGERAGNGNSRVVENDNAVLAQRICKRLRLVLQRGAVAAEVVVAVNEVSPVSGLDVPKQRAGGARATRKRTTPVSFGRESADELRKVVWPTATQLRQYFVVVLVFVLLVIASVSALDLLFGWGLLKIFG